MRVLVVVKTTNYELHGSNIEARVTAGRVAVETLERLKTAHHEHYQTLEKLRVALRRGAVEFKEVSRDSKPHQQKTFDAVVTVGGDGTLLSASHQMVDGGRILGLRSSASSVGYLCCAGPDEVTELVSKIKSDSHSWTQVSRIKAEINCLHPNKVIETVPVLNDFLYANISPAATTRYRLRFQKGHKVDEVHRSSGIWISTPIGSTAGIYAAGGSKMPIEATEFQFRVRELYRLGLTKPELDHGIFNPDTDLLEIENRCPQAILALDGQHGEHNLGYGDVIRFKRAAPLFIARPDLVNA
jgi:NAD+ kinase